MRIVFRTDASRIIGTGHLMRCLTLADLLRARGAAVSFVCREDDDRLSELATARGHAVAVLPRGSAVVGVSGGDHAGWLGASWEEDADQTRASIAGLGETPDWLVVDHYAIDHRWHSALRRCVRRIMVIDDLADRRHDCDLLLDQNLVVGMHDRYRELVPPGSGLLLGPQWALLQPQYADLRRRIGPRTGPVRRILVFFGGVDADDLTGRSISAFRTLDRTDIEMDVVVGPANPHAQSLRHAVECSPGIRLHFGLTSLAPLMARADLALGAAGSASWERLCLGLPSLVATLAHNQEAIAEGLRANDLADVLEDVRTLNAMTLGAALAAAIARGCDTRRSERCRLFVDGRGAERVSAILMLDENARLRTRPGSIDDVESVAAWRELEMRGLFIPPAPSVDGAESRGGFRACLGEFERARVYVVESPDGVAMAAAAFEHEGTRWRMVGAWSAALRDHSGARRAAVALLEALRRDEPGVIEIDSGTKPRRSGALHLSLCSDEGSWINSSAPELLLDWLAQGHDVAWAHDAEQLAGSDVCFYLSYERIVGRVLLDRHGNNLVVHASALPAGRGWSPLTWQILEGHARVPVTLFEAAESVDSGQIYDQVFIEFGGGELVSELRMALAHATVQLCAGFIRGYPQSRDRSCDQTGEPSFYPRRRPADSRIDIDRSLAEQFDLLRVADPDRYPAWFELRGRRYVLRVEHLDR